MANDLDKLNRLRQNAGKNPLKAFKAGQEKLDTAIKALEDAGYTDVVPGANTEATPQTDDPEVKAAIEEPPAKPEPKKTNGKPALARGLDSEPQYSAHSRKAVRDIREAEKKAKLSPEDKQQIKDEAEARRKRGEVDAKKDPKKAKRQQQHIKDKQEKRKKEGKVAKSREKDPDQVTVADIARELDIDPKVARAKLRRYEGKKDFPKPVKGERWTFPKAAKAALVKILK